MRKNNGKCVSVSVMLSGFPKPTITWSKLRAPLPWRHKLVNNSLVLPSVGRQDSGQYICNATNHMGTSEVTVMVDVESELRIFFLLLLTDLGRSVILKSPVKVSQGDRTCVISSKIALGVNKYVYSPLVSFWIHCDLFLDTVLTEDK